MSSFTQNNLTYEVQTGNQTVRVTGNTITTVINNLIIPPSVTQNGVTYTVTGIDPNAFVNKTTITGHLELPNTIEIIHYDAFKNCSELTSVVIPYSVTTVFPGAFRGTTKLLNVIIERAAYPTPDIVNGHDNLPMGFENKSGNPLSTITFYNLPQEYDLTASNQLWLLRTYFANKNYISTRRPIPLSNFNINNTNFSETFLTLPTPITNINIGSTPLSFTYTSSDTSIASVSGNILSLNNIGTVTITATAAATTNYGSNSLSSTFTINGPIDKLPANLRNFSFPNLEFGLSPFEITAPESDSNGGFTYTSSNTLVATISGSTVTIVGAGTSTITGTQAETSEYLSGSINATLTVNKAMPNITAFNNITKVFNDPDFNLTPPTSNSYGLFTYTSSNTLVATISGSTVTIVGAGNSIITATQAESSNYLTNSINTTFIVNKALPTLTNFTNLEKIEGEESFQIIAPTSNSPGLFTYTSSDINVISILGNVVTIKKPGISEITATQASTPNYLSNNIKLTILVKKSSLSNPAVVTSSEGISTFLESDSQFCGLVSDIIISEDQPIFKIDLNLTLKNKVIVNTGTKVVVLSLG